MKYQESKAYLQISLNLKKQQKKFKRLNHQVHPLQANLQIAPINKARTYLNLSQKKAKRLNQKKMNQVISILRVLYINLLKMEKISWH